ncbi:MAG TPA: tetratricopeptide repeat protein [Terriglobales bacterium]|nr:tetratricopeptide repeat protein [Terriglobales bacterium]
MPKLFRFCPILFFLLIFSCVERTVVIERPSPAPTPPTEAKNDGQTAASEKHFTNGKKFYNQGKYPKALQELNKSVEADPQNREAYYYLGLCYQKLDYYKESVPEFRRSLEKSNADNLFLSRVRFSLAFSLEKIGALEESEAQYQLAYSLDTSNQAAFKGIQRVKEKSGKQSRIKIKEE